jgi:hypothetical protein
VPFDDKVFLLAILLIDKERLTAAADHDTSKARSVEEQGGHHEHRYYPFSRCGARGNRILLPADPAEGKVPH